MGICYTASHLVSMFVIGIAIGVSVTLFFARVKFKLIVGEEDK